MLSPARSLTRGNSSAGGSCSVSVRLPGDAGAASCISTYVCFPTPYCERTAVSDPMLWGGMHPVLVAQKSPRTSAHWPALAEDAPGRGELTQARRVLYRPSEPGSPSADDWQSCSQRAEVPAHSVAVLRG